MGTVAKNLSIIMSIIGKIKSVIGWCLQTIIDHSWAAWARGASSDVVCVGSSVIIKLFAEKVNNKHTKNLEFSTRVGRDHNTSIKVLKQVGVVHDIKSQ